MLQEAKSGGGDRVVVARADLGEAGTITSFDVFQGLVIAIDGKDRYTKRHSEDVARYGLFLGRLVGLDDEQLEAIQVAGLLHDVGKIGVPDAVLRKPGKLDRRRVRGRQAARRPRRPDRPRPPRHRRGPRRHPPPP